jgi:hypothetical protein
VFTAPCAWAERTEGIDAVADAPVGMEKDGSEPQMLDRRGFILALGPSLAAGQAGWAEERPGRKAADRGDHDRARRALQRGEIRSLSEILADLKPELGGEVIEVELKSKNGGYLYKFKILPSSGRLWEVYVDAATGKITKREPD